MYETRKIMGYTSTDQGHYLHNNLGKRGNFHLKLLCSARELFLKVPSKSAYKGNPWLNGRIDEYIFTLQLLHLI